MTVGASDLRRCILGAIPENVYDEPFEVKYLYIPSSHVKALDPNRALVVGGRGTGKTFWWETLASELGAELLSDLFDTRKEGLRYEVSIGHGAKVLDAGRPLDPDTLATLFKEFPERVVWKTVVLYRIATARFEGMASWRDRVRWVHEQPEEAARVLAETDDALYAQKRRHLVVFDALDRTAMLWQDVVKAHRGLFGLLLDLWGMRAVRAKAFVRTDVLADPEVLRFPDASKLHTAAVHLTWPLLDLYGLLWQYLANSNEEATAFRSIAPGEWGRRIRGVWHAPALLRTNGDAQQALWHHLAGRWMGANERRGDTYRWLTNHLADAFGAVSPRSFLAAVRAAAESTGEEDPQAISQRAIQEGVRNAAEIRAREIREDFPWADQALEALRGMMVPCEVDEVLEAWKREELGAIMDRDPEARRRRGHGGELPGVIEDLAELGVMQDLGGGRINVPDVYRLRFGIKRRGGVPARRV